MRPFTAKRTCSPNLLLFQEAIVDSLDNTDREVRGRDADKPKQGCHYPYGRDALEKNADEKLVR